MRLAVPTLHCRSGPEARPNLPTAETHGRSGQARTWRDAYSRSMRGCWNGCGHVAWLHAYRALRATRIVGFPACSWRLHRSSSIAMSNADRPRERGHSVCVGRNTARRSSGAIRFDQRSTAHDTRARPQRAAIPLHLRHLVPRPIPLCSALLRSALLRVTTAFYSHNGQLFVRRLASLPLRAVAKPLPLLLCSVRPS